MVFYFHHICHDKQGYAKNHLRKKRVSAEYISEKGSFALESVLKWIDTSNEHLPTIKQAKKIASILHVPFASLYMEPRHIPQNSLPRIQNMRTMMDSTYGDDSALNIATMDLLLQRDFLISINDDLDIPTPKFTPFMPSDNGSGQWAKAIRSHFDISLNFQYQSASPRKFYLYLRSQIESRGIFVHGFTDVPVESVRGLAIYDPIMPIIGVNADDRPPAKSFTIIHELVHILKRESTYCNEMYAAFASKQEEVFCNAVSGEFLVPQEALLSITAHYQRPYSLDNIKQLANKFSVSREVITRRLLDLNEIGKNEYEAYNEQFKIERELEREKKRLSQSSEIAPPIKKIVSREVIDRTSPSVCKALYIGLNEDLISKKSISYHLGVSQKHIDKILSEVASWNN